MTEPDRPDDTLWAFEDEIDHRYVYVTDIDWPARKVHYVAYGPQHHRTDGDMFLKAFAQWTTRDGVVELP